MYKVEFVKSAAKELKKLDKNDQKRIFEALKQLKVNPFSELIKYRKVKAKDNLFRIRVGDFRIVYSIEKEILTILVIRIGHRKDVYRRLH